MNRKSLLNATPALSILIPIVRCCSVAYDTCENNYLYFFHCARQPLLLLHFTIVPISAPAAPIGLPLADPYN